MEIKLIGKTGVYLMNAALDTGSTFTIIPWKIAEILGYDPALSKDKTPITTASGNEVIPLITLERIEALGIKREKVKVGCHDLPPQTTVNALLGLSFLRNIITKLDLKEGFLEMKDP